MQRKDDHDPTVLRVAHATVGTPIGPFTVLVRVGGPVPVVLASGWTDDTALLVSLVHPSLRPAALAPAVRSIEGVTDAVVAYHDGELGRIDAVAVEQRAGTFTAHAWDVLRTVPPGRPLTYLAFAGACGNDAAVRAAAGACARNAAALFVPCHRVVRTGGAPGGFRWGLDVKRWLLAHEA